MTKITETGIIIADLKESPVFQCVAFQQISSMDVKGKWRIVGYEVFKYCIIDDIDRRQKNLNLPCLRDGHCIWKDILDL